MAAGIADILHRNSVIVAREDDELSSALKRMCLDALSNRGM